MSRKDHQKEPPKIVDSTVKSLYYDILNYKDSRRARTASDIANAERFQEVLDDDYRKILEQEREARLKKDDRKALRRLKQKAREGKHEKRKKRARSTSQSSSVSIRGKSDEDEIPFYMKDASIRAAQKERQRQKDKHRKKTHSRRKHRKH